MRPVFFFKLDVVQFFPNAFQQLLTLEFNLTKALVKAKQSLCDDVCTLANAL